MSADPAIDLHAVAKRFGQKAALCATTFQVARGEVVGFVGPNGAGKSTCLRILIGLVRRDAGSARVLGLDPADQGLAIRRRCSYLPGETSVYQHMSGRQFLDFALGFYPACHDDLAAELTQFFELPLHRRVRTYSAGMKQKLALMATLLPDVELYLLDEPDRALDATARLFLRDVLRRLQARGKTILLSSHHLSEVEALAHRLVFLVNGRVIDPERVRAAQDLLRREIRLRLRDGATLPDGVHEAEREPDGTWRVRVAEEPLRWVSRLDGSQVTMVEVGNIRLEELYRLLLDASGHEAASVTAPAAGESR